MIDFQSIRYTTAGLECYYLGQRRSGDQVLHRFAVVNPAGEKFAYYNEQGQRIEYLGPGAWVVQNDGHQIIAPPKIVEVTRWFRLEYDEGCRDNCYVEIHIDKPDLTPSTLDIQQHTFRFEVPNE